MLLFCIPVSVVPIVKIEIIAILLNLIGRVKTILIKPSVITPCRVHTHFHVCKSEVIIGGGKWDAETVGWGGELEVGGDKSTMVPN